MNTSHVRTTSIALIVTLFAALSSSCAVEGGGYGYGGSSVSIGLDYYEPYGGYYGGWGSGYRVGPSRGDHHDYHGHTTHAYRPAPASHSAHSIPSRPHASNDHRH